MSLPRIALPLLAAAALIVAMAGLKAQETRVQIGEFGDQFVISVGGKLYDNLWVMTETEPPKGRNPAFPKDVVIGDTDTWRCVSCHGWDYAGTDGERGQLGDHDAFRSLRHLVGAPLEDIASKIRAAPHDYSEEAIAGYTLDIIALFIAVGQYDSAVLLGKTLADGNAVRGRDIFEGACMNCHQPDGRAFLTGEAGDRSSLGWVVRNRPEQALHKIRNGVPGADMLAVGFLEDDQIRDLFAFLQVLDPKAE